MRTPALFLVTGLALAACAPTPSPDPMGEPQRCDAAGSQSLIGTHYAAVSFPAGANVRIVCTTCPTTRDLRPDRLNIRYNRMTGVIEQVDCG
jgi:hypothetical protein